MERKCYNCGSMRMKYLKSDFSRPLLNKKIGKAYVIECQVFECKDCKKKMAFDLQILAH